MKKLNLNSQKKLGKRKSIIIMLSAVLLLLVGYASYLLSPSFEDNVNDFFHINTGCQERPCLVKGTIENASISISFQDNIDETTANNILTSYAKDNINMSFDIFQDRICLIWLNPLTPDIYSEAQSLEKKAEFESVNPTIFEGKNSIHTTARSQDCGSLKNKLQSFGYTTTLYDVTPVLAVVQTSDTKNKKKLLNQLQKDTNFKDVRFEYPI